MQVTLFPAPSGAASNLSYTTEPIGFGAHGQMTAVTAGTSNSSGGAWATVGTNTNAWSGFWIVVGKQSTTNSRYYIDLSLDAGSTKIVPNLWDRSAEVRAAG